MIVTIDGQAASGKTSVARTLAQRLNMFYLYTGMLYRAVAFILRERKGENWLYESPSLQEDDISFISSIEYFHADQNPVIVIDGRDITNKLHHQSLDQLASIISAYPEVRSELLDVQRCIAEKYDIIADGRDCGTVVFPDAECKFFLTASIERRANRIFNNPKRRGSCATVEEVAAKLKERDKRDQTRTIAPLTIPNDAIEIDNSDMTREETLDFFLEKIESCRDVQEQSEFA